MITGKSTYGPISKYLNRKISSKITSFIVKHDIGISPNTVSVLSFMMGLACLPLYVFKYIVPAGILVQVSSIIDGVDGELARARGLSSSRGAFMDAMLDRYADIAILIGLIICIQDSLLNPVLLATAVMALSGSLMVSYLHVRSTHDLNIHPSLVGVLDGIASRDVRLFLIFIFSVLGLLVELLIVLAVLTHVYVFVKSIAVVRHASKTADADGGDRDD